MLSYEDALATVSDLKVSNERGHRDITWVTGSNVVGLARTAEGRLEIFLSGERLHPASRVVAELLEYQEWFRTGGSGFFANRLVLPALGYFDQIVAFICTELVRSGADSHLATAFATSEPIIEIALRRLRLSDEAHLGLLGELLLLDELCRRQGSTQMGAILDGWTGWKRARRDFRLGGTGVEVKATLRETSSHYVQGTHQVELSDGADGDDPENALFLVSVGLRPSEPHAESFHLAGLVERCVMRLREAGRADLIGPLLFRVREYGSDNGLGYDHSTMRSDVAFNRPFETHFVRCYNMTDPSIDVLRAGDVLRHAHVDHRSVAFRINLPNTVRGDLNPVHGLRQSVDAIVASTFA